MKKIYFLKYLLCLLGVLIFATAPSQNFKLLDVNKTKNSNPNNYQFSSKNSFAELKGSFYFQADDGIHGIELYKSDGTADGTQLVKDITPGSRSSNPYDITVSGGKIYFIATDQYGSNQKLWVSDGTEAGTKLIEKLPPGVGNYSYLSLLTDVTKTLYFSYNYADSNYYYTQIWKTDGTDSGTVMVANLEGFGLQQLTNVNGKLFFTFYDYATFSGYKLYTSDGTPEGTKPIADINPFSSSPAHFTALHGLLYFSGDDGSGNKLWVSDGTTEGTHPVKNKHNIYLFYGNGYEIDPFTVKSNTLFFQGGMFDSSANSGFELCRYNTTDTNNNIQLVKDIIPGHESSNPGYITNVNGTLFFIIYPTGDDVQLWKSDGTKAGTVLVKDINPHGQNAYYGLTNAHGTLLFVYANDVLGYELWKSNGTSAGTKLVKDIFPGPSSSYPRYITYKNGIFIFGATGTKGAELWRSDGTETGTVMVKDINHTTTSSSYPWGFTPLSDDRVMFSADNGKDQGYLHVTDGSDAGTKHIDTSVYAQQSYYSQQLFINLKNETYFVDYTNRLWKTNGTKAGTALVTTSSLAASGLVLNLATTDDLLYIFIYNSTTNQIEMWRTDGTEQGTFILKSDFPSFFSLFPTAIGNTLFFSTFDYSSGGQLWKTDGTIDGTKLVKNVGSSNPAANLYNFKGKLYFSAYTVSNSFGPSLWTSDGTEEGTYVVKDVAVVQIPFAQANGKLFFYALDAISKGYELFASDGTANGTKIVKDINEGGYSSSVYSLTSGDTIVYFIADDGKHGLELWKSNSTSKGTKLVKDITRGPNGTYLNNMVNVKDNLFFTVNDTLWQSDGTKENTHTLKDENITGVTQISNLTAIGGSLYFSGYTYASGQELYVGSAHINKAPAVSISTADSIVKYIAPATIRLRAAASDQDGTISKVQFYNGSVLLHTETEAPYTYTWKDVSEGDYTLTAVATDNDGAAATSDVIHISVLPNKAPIVSIVNPADNENFTAPATISLTASAEDVDGTISKVEFYNGSILIGTQYFTPYTSNWKDVPAGTYTITAKAIDNLGLSATSEPVTVTVSGTAIVSSKPSSVNDNTATKGGLTLQVYPNPANKTLNISTKGLQQNKPVAISIISVSGIELKKMQTNSTNKPITVDVSSMSSGVYMIKVTSGNKVMSKKFVKL